MNQHPRHQNIRDDQLDAELGLRATLGWEWNSGCSCWEKRSPKYEIGMSVVQENGGSWTWYTSGVRAGELFQGSVEWALEGIIAAEKKVAELETEIDRLSKGYKAKEKQ